MGPIYLFGSRRSTCPSGAASAYFNRGSQMQCRQSPETVVSPLCLGRIRMRCLYVYLLGSLCSPKWQPLRRLNSLTSSVLPAQYNAHCSKDMVLILSHSRFVLFYLTLRWRSSGDSFYHCKSSHSRLLQKGPEHQVPLAIFYGGNVSNISPKKDKGIYQGRMLIPETGAEGVPPHFCKLESVIAIAMTEYVVLG